VADRARLSALLEAELARGRALLSEAGRILVLTGAGVSAESGVPTFRGPDGIWNRYRPEELATPEAFRRDPRLVWEWYAWRRERVAACLPNPAHHALAALVRRREGARIATQNVDGLHERAAREAASGGELRGAEWPLELHGSLLRARCTRCAGRGPLPERLDTSSAERLPRCAACGSLLRPDVVWFGEALDPGVSGEAFALATDVDLCLVVGTSGLVHPAASLPVVAREGGAALLEVNPEPTPLTASCALSLRGPAGVILPALLEG
jgi:NAD-dependent deacetylase